jgi:hypothetical protein
MATDPIEGIPAKISFLNLAEIRKLLDGLHAEHFETQARFERANRKAIAAPAPDPEADRRILKGLQELSAHLKSGFSPASIYRRVAS